MKYNVFKVGDIVRLANMYDNSEMCFENLIGIIIKIEDDVESTKTVVDRSVINEIENTKGYEATREFKKAVLIKILSPIDEIAYQEFINDTCNWHEEELSVSTEYLLNEHLAGFFAYQLAHVSGKIKVNTTALQMFLR